MLRRSETEHRVGTPELARAAQYATLGPIQADKPLPAAIKAQCDLNDRLSLEVSRLQGVAHRLSAQGAAEGLECSEAQRPSGLLSELEAEQVRTSRLVNAMARLNDHLETLI